jgi:hypothetical protein
MLERTVPYAEHMKNSFYAYRGTVMHAVVENASEVKLLQGRSLRELGYISEWQMACGFCLQHGGFWLPDGVEVFDESTWDKLVCPECKKSRVPKKKREVFILGGTLDGFEPHWDLFIDGTLFGVLWDLKTMKEYAVHYFVKGDDKNTYHRHVKDSHYLQGQVYKYLISRSPPPEDLKRLGVERVRLLESHIQAFSMGEFPRTGGQYRWRAHWKHEYTNWEIPGIDFKDDDWIEQYIKERARPIYKALILGEAPGKIIPSDEEKPDRHHWLCDYCAFQGSEFCPDPASEWEALKEGASEQEAFQLAKEKS